MHNPNGWTEQLEAALAEHRVAGMVQALQSQATAHAGTAPAKVKRAALKRIEQWYRNDRLAHYQLAMELAATGNPTAEELAAHLLAGCHDLDAPAVSAALHNLADSPHWEVREWVAGACGDLLQHHFNEFYPTIVTWARDKSEHVRRTVVLAVMYAGNSGNEALADRVLDVVEILLSDRAAYVRNNLGPFCIGDGLLKSYPDQVLTRMARWVNCEDEQVRWNLAMAFTAAQAAALATTPDAQAILQKLDADERPYVKKAVTKAFRNLQKRTCVCFYHSDENLTGGMGDDEPIDQSGHL